MTDSLHSNNALGSSDCRMIDIKVPVRSSLWSGTGTVMVAPRACFLHDYMTAFAPNLCKVRFSRGSPRTSRPENTAEPRQLRLPPALRILHGADDLEFRWQKRSQKIVQEPLSDSPVPLPRWLPDLRCPTQDRAKRSHRSSRSIIAVICLVIALSRFAVKACHPGEQK